MAYIMEWRAQKPPPTFSGWMEVNILRLADLPVPDTKDFNALPEVERGNSSELLRLTSDEDKAMVALLGVPLAQVYRRFAPTPADVDKRLARIEACISASLPTERDLGSSRIEHVLRHSALSPDAVVTVDEVIEILGGRSAVVRKWLRTSVVPLRHPTGRVIYRWGDVLQVMRRAA